MTKFDLHIINNRSYVTNAKQMRGRWWLCAFTCPQIDENNHNYILCNRIHVVYIHVNQQPFTFQATFKYIGDDDCWNFQNENKFETFRM